MGRSPCCDDTSGLKKGPWTQEEDELLTSYIQKNGHGSWRALPKSAGLNRCGKSCRLRWTNYLRPDIKRGKFSEEEEDMIIKLHSVLGNKWSRIAAHLPGRTDNEIKNYWNTHLRKKLLQMDEQVLAGTPGFLDEGRSSLRNAFINLDVGRNRMGFEHDGDGPSKQIEASEYWHGKNKHMMNNSRVMSQHESIDSTSHSVTSKALSKEATSLLRTERTMGRAIDDGHRMKQRKSQLGTRDGRCKSILSARQDGMFLMYTVWAKHKENEITFKFKAESSFGELKQELAERLTLECGKLKIKYLDAPENLARGEPCDPNASIVRDWVLMTCDADLRQCERYSLGMKILLIIQENQDSRALLSEMFVPE